MFLLSTKLYFAQTGFVGRMIDDMVIFVLLLNRHYKELKMNQFKMGLLKKNVNVSVFE